MIESIVNSIPAILYVGLAATSGVICYRDYQDRKEAAKESQLSLLREHYETARSRAVDTLINEATNCMIGHLEMLDTRFGNFENKSIMFSNDMVGKAPFQLPLSSTMVIEFADIDLKIIRVACHDSLTVRMQLFGRYVGTANLWFDSQMVAKWARLETLIKTRHLPKNIGNLLIGFNMNHAKNILASPTFDDLRLTDHKAIENKADMIYSAAMSLVSR